MPGLHWHLYVYVGRIFNLLSDFSKNFGNINVVTGGRPIADLDTRSLTKALRVVKAFITQFELAQSTNSPIPFCRSTIYKYQVNPLNNTKCALPGYSFSANNTNADVDSRTNETQNSRCNEGAKPDSAGTPDHSNAKAQANQCMKKPCRSVTTTESAKRNVMEMGMFFLSKPDMKATDVFPKGMAESVCANFTCKGRGCTREDCTFLHPRKVSNMKKETINAIGDHFLEKKVGWFNEWHFLKAMNELPAKYKKLMGRKDGLSSPDESQSPPKVFCPFQTPETFDQKISNKIHKHLVSRPHSTKGKPLVQARPCLFDKETRTSGPLITNDTINTAMNAKANTLAEVATSTIPKETNDDLTIIAGTREKRRIIDAYKKHFGLGYPDSIIMTRKGKQVSTASDLQLLNKRMRPSKEKYYRVETLELHCVIATFLKDFRQDFQLQDLHNLCLVCKTFASMIPKIIRWLKIDFSLLCEPRYKDEKQEHIGPHRVEMASAAMVYFGLDPGKFVRWLEGKYTGYHRNVQTTLDAVQSHVTPDNFEHMKWILLDGCPAEFMFTEPLDNKLAMLKRGNLKTFKANPDLIKKAMNKEDCYSPLVPINEDICRASAFCHSTTQTVVIKPGKANQIA
jgi:hypothetical protein